MGLYEGIKDVAKVVQQADNIELYKKLLDLSAQALDMQAEIAMLKEENGELRKKKNMSGEIIRHPESYITLKNELPALYYCTHCWDVDGRLVQLSCSDYNGSFLCPHCGMTGIYDKEKERRALGEEAGNNGRWEY